MSAERTAADWLSRPRTVFWGDSPTRSYRSSGRIVAELHGPDQMFTIRPQRTGGTSAGTTLPLRFVEQTSDGALSGFATLSLQHA